MEISDIRRGLGLENLDPEDIDRIKLQLQQINDTIQGGLRSANFKEYRNTYVINAQDSLDENFPLYVHFNIISEMTKIVSIKLSFWLLNFRAYAKAASSGGAVSSASGGGETPTSSSVSTPSGGGATSGATGSASGGGSTTPSGGGSTTPSGGGSTSGSSAAIYQQPCYIDANGFVKSGGVDYSLLYYDSAVALHLHTHATPNHTHATPDHTHPNHTHSTPDHTHPAHTHTVTIAAHTHNIEHTHNVPAHSHGITYGIFEEETSPTIMPSISRDNGLTYSLPIGSYTKNQETLDITRFIDTAGSKIIKFTSNLRARLSVQIEIKLDIKAR